MSIKRESLCNLRNFPSKKNHTCVISIIKIWIFLKLSNIHYILRVYSCIWKKNWPIIIGNKFEITKNQSLLRYLPIEGFPYHQAHTYMYWLHAILVMYFRLQASVFWCNKRIWNDILENLWWVVLATTLLVLPIQWFSLDSHVFLPSIKVTTTIYTKCTWNIIENTIP